MYDRYTIYTAREVLEKAFGANAEKDYSPTWNACPTKKLPVITMQEPRQVQLYFWGLVPRMANNKSLSPRLYNLIGDLAFQRPMYQKALKERRCLVLADGFYIWKQISKKQRVPYYCYRPDGKVMAIAGLWENFEDLDGNVDFTFNMITKPAQENLLEHQPDMPAVLEEGIWRQWLDPKTSVEGLEQLLKAGQEVPFFLHAVSPSLTDNQKDGKTLISPAVPSDQHGNYTLFS